jgi:hypothetical protein
MDIGGNNHAPARHFVADKIRSDALTFGDVLHLLRDLALPGVIHLCTDAVAGAPRYPFGSHTESIILT